MKTKKYTIQFESLEKLLSTEIEISQKEYYKQLTYLLEEVNKTKDFEEENKITKLSEDEEETKTMRINQIYFQNCTATVILTKYRCKEGYAFRNKKID